MPRRVPELASARLRLAKARLIELTVAPAMLAGVAPVAVVNRYWVELLRPEM